MNVLARLVERIVSGAKAVDTTFVAFVKRMVTRFVRFVVAGRVQSVMTKIVAHSVITNLSVPHRTGFHSK